jgi:predicted nuclease with TOPRIM domain
LNWLNKDEGILDYLVKALTGISLLFGMWVYVDTIHPVFEKERELQILKSENTSLEKVKAQLTKETVDLNNLVNSLKTTVSELERKESDLNLAISNRESELDRLKGKLSFAESEAVQNKLNYFTDKLINSYLIAISSGRGDKFNVVQQAKILLKSHSKHSTKYDKKAYEIFSDYVKNNSDKDFMGESKVIEFSLMLSHRHEIERLKK